jgi:hypothetical protein
MKINKKNNGLFLLMSLMSLTIQAQKISNDNLKLETNGDSLKVFLAKSDTKPMYVDIIFENTLCDSMMISSWYRYYDNEMMQGGASGFMIHVYVNGSLSRLPSEHEFVFKFNEKRWISIPPHSQILFSISLEYFNPSKDKTIGVQFWMNYVFSYKGEFFNKFIKTNYLELWNAEKDTID